VNELRKNGCEGLDWIHIILAGSGEHNEKYLGSIKAGKLLVMSIKLADEHPGICSLNVVGSETHSSE
jgi:hypothetical protein